jgi:hypothetical protein
MSSTSVDVLVLGSWHDGFYPIEWRVDKQDASEEWRLFGIPTAAPLDREDCERILGAMKGTK